MTAELVAQQGPTTNNTRSKEMRKAVSFSDMNQFQTIEDVDFLRRASICCGPEVYRRVRNQVLEGGLNDDEERQELEMVVQQSRLNSIQKPRREMFQKLAASPKGQRSTRALSKRRRDSKCGAPVRSPAMCA